MMAQDSRVWAEAIFGKCALGDARRVNRAINVAAGLAERALIAGSLEAAYSLQTGPVYMEGGTMTGGRALVPLSRCRWRRISAIVPMNQGDRSRV